MLALAGRRGKEGESFSREARSYFLPSFGNSSLRDLRAPVDALIAKHGGRYLTKPGCHDVLETDNAVWQPQRVVSVGFPDISALQAWYQSPEYAPLIEIRRQSAKELLITLDGA